MRDKKTYAEVCRLWGLRAVVAVVAAIVCVCGFSGCNTQGCSDNRSALPLAGFYSTSTDRPLMLDSIDLGGVGAINDSLLVRSGESVNSLYLPFRFDKESTSFFIRYNYPEQGLSGDALNDTITFRYTSEPYFASAECGAYFIYKIGGIDYTKHLIDSVAIVDSVINNVDLERIKIYIRTAEPSQPEGQSGEEPASATFKNAAL